MALKEKWQLDVTDTVRLALQEDIGDGDITAELIPPHVETSATVITREDAILCGQAWVNEVFRQIDPQITIEWQANDGEKVTTNQTLFHVKGSARNLLTAERNALNFLQLLSGTATRCRHYADLVKGTSTKLLDTRKTIPGLRTAQKYAVSCGGCYNHRIGLYDAFLIKENHIHACGSISAAVETARQNHPNKPVEVEVENLSELDEALTAAANTIMLDNFSLENLREAVRITQGRAALEASGGITTETLRAIAETDVDYISIGALTKDCVATDLSMRFDA